MLMVGGGGFELRQCITASSGEFVFMYIRGPASVRLEAGTLKLMFVSVSFFGVFCFFLFFVFKKKAGDSCVCLTIYGFKNVNMQ